MKPWVLLDWAEGPGGEPFELVQRDSELAIRAQGRLLMSSRQHGSEEAMAGVIGSLERGTAPGSRPLHILIGGLGLGYTLRAVLDRLNPTDTVTLAELSPAIVAWNRGVLAPLAGRPLEDPRVKLVVGDIATVLRGPAAGFDAILLDVDNGPEALTIAGNQQLYAAPGLAWLKQALRPGGIAVVWSASGDAAFESRVRRAGFMVERIPVSARGGHRGASHVLFVARRPR